MNLEDVQQLVERAKQRGMNPIERLDCMGLILTDERHVQLAREVCVLMADRLEQVPFSHLSPRGVSISPLDVRRAIVEYIRKNFSENPVE